ncbi:endonuclease domain-containing protein [Sphingomonas sp. NCPPB 2930]|uniref:endonuclease domain-containing protein n=1 Tax=Sphingomonas sp. NCPPB 2930 TaxID=3162788 RepID=UPI0036D991D7
MGIATKPGRTVRRARGLRRDMTLPEVLLWRVLRERPEGLRFRRQHPAGAYVLDFYCPAARLAVEVDGEAHERGDRPERDARRDAFLGEHGVAVLRIAARDVLRDLDHVVLYIIAQACDRLPLHRPPDGPPPQVELGEE